ncbi:hypothetical protein ACFDR9_005535 [Janthinobacterium sp. CG_23.3]|uniref:DUF4810 domain-containing protein n=1 Tax=unclassified Janthinobacterium TaxID=2610881 RepID=UPI0006879787|nr:MULTISPECIES: DUF4810 domain-containing protein [unclassified Janthinobacterium]MEC5159931.1 hypothetical protein [Janthinobacterium sp. CG_S6]
MHTLITKPAAIALVVAMGAVLTGCHTAPKTLYQWDGYQPQVYQHFKGESPDQQIAVLEKNLLLIDSNGNMAPPGYHAHLGMLYAMTGKDALVAPQFEAEKKLFPESAAYMDFLLKKNKKSEK